MGAEYCDDSVCLSVSLSVSACVSAASVPLERTTCSIVTKFTAHALWPWLGSPLTDFRFYGLDDVKFAENMRR